MGGVGGAIATAVAAALSHSLWPVLVGGGLEAAWVALWMYRPKPASWTQRFEALQAGLGEKDKARVARLEARRQEIVASAETNSRFAGGLLKEEIEKLKDIVEAFTTIVASIARWERHLSSVDFDDMESEMRKHESDAARAIDPAQRDLARQNLAILMERQTSLTELRKKLGHARGELDLMENSLKLVADKVHVIEHPREVGRELDDLLIGVEAVREMTSDRAPAPQRHAISSS